MARVLIAGCGYVGSALGRSLAGDGNTVFGVRRHPAGLPDPIEPVAADLAVPATLQAIPKDLQQIVYAVSPGGAEDLLYRTAYVDGLRNLLDLLRERDEHPTRIVFVSSTAVYGQSDAEWVDETTDGAPTHWSGKRLLEAEALLRDSEFPGTVLRLGGIYGPRRTRMLQRIRYADKEANYCARCQTDGKLLADRSLSRLLKKDWPKTLDELEARRGPR